MFINSADPKSRGPAILLNTDANSSHIQVNGTDGLPRAKLDVDSNSPSKPDWQFDNAASAKKAQEEAQKAAQTEKH